ncbi:MULTISPECIES: CbrC family protein [Bacillus]|nr:CbrC family protein [Bacillus pumilus]MCC9089256.1 CbrC family protein [Bacillus pumilus]UUD41817.1 CbrC family protein [Bacillus pumilus]
MTLPTFKYNPDPISLNVIKKEHTTCPVCEKERDLCVSWSILFR